MYPRGVFCARGFSAVIISQVVPTTGGELTGTVDTIELIAFAPEKSSLDITTSHVLDISTSVGDAGCQSPFAFRDLWNGGVRDGGGAQAHHQHGDAKACGDEPIQQRQ